MAILDLPVLGDASLRLAQQLIAAKLSVADGASPAPVADLIALADEQLGSFTGAPPYHVPPSASFGEAMTWVAGALENYNGTCDADPRLEATRTVLGDTARPPRALPSTGDRSSGSMSKGAALSATAAGLLAFGVMLFLTTPRAPR
jgi:hypothetical protein